MSSKKKKAKQKQLIGIQDLDNVSKFRLYISIGYLCTLAVGVIGVTYVLLSEYFTIKYSITNMEIKMEEVYSKTFPERQVSGKQITRGAQTIVPYDALRSTVSESTYIDCNELVQERDSLLRVLGTTKIPENK